MAQLMEPSEPSLPSQASSKPEYTGPERPGKGRFTFWAYVLLGIAIATSVILLYMRSQPLPPSHVGPFTEIYDANGELIESLSEGRNAQNVALSDVSPHIIQATLCIEDRNFYHHPGFDPKGIARAMLVNLQHMSKVQGAGTITQQLARNLYLSHERTWKRKLKETYYAVQMELQLSKENILEQYLNQIYYGHSTYGIQAASHLYFKKDAKDLTLAESALLAGIPKGPRYYSPHYDLQGAKDRRNVVLTAMASEGLITREEADKASAEPVAVKPLEARKPALAGYFRDYVRMLAIEQYGISEDLYETGGLKVYTTLDSRMQKAAEAIINKQLAKLPDIQAALVAIEPQTGHIRAMVGGRNYADNQFNRATASSRQPGSAFKPIVYLTALQNKSFTPLSRVKSEPTTFTYDRSHQTYTPGNFGNQYYGPIDMRQAIAKSDNIYAVHTLLEIGMDHVIDTARKLGITSTLKPLPSLALGTFPVSPLELNTAYATIANQGVRIEPVAITRIEDGRDHILYLSQPEREKIVDPAPAFVLSHLMQGVFEQGGTGNRVASTLKRPVAGKTGTTNTDAWLAGFTPDLSTTVWIGYDKGRNLSNAEAHLAAPIFAEFTEKALEQVPPKPFPVPEDAVIVTIDPASGKLSNEDCPTGRQEAFIKGTEPQDYCTKKQPIKKNDPQPAEEKPKVRKWLDQMQQWWQEHKPHLLGA